MNLLINRSAFADQLRNDEELSVLFSMQTDVEQMLRFEVALARGQADLGLIPAEHAAAIADAVKIFKPDFKALQDGLLVDGIAAPELIREFRATLPEPVKASLHVGATSQDLVDTSLMVRLKSTISILKKRIAGLQTALAKLESEASDKPTLKSRTRMQVALPMSAKQKLLLWKEPIAQGLLAAPDFFPIQLGGPDGTAESFGENYPALRDHMAKAMELDAPEVPWHTHRKPLLDMLHWINLITIGVGKIATDVLIMSQTEVGEVSIDGAGGSSSMAHKKNPVVAEFVLAQARTIQIQIGGIMSASIHENERSGTSLAVEWMLLPEIMITFGNMLNRSQQMLNRLEFVSD